MFLLFAAADLAFPQLCAEENESLFAVQKAAMFAHAGESSDEQPHLPAAEDCFCCCSHIVSASMTSPLNALAIVSSPNVFPAPSVSAAPARHLFRPPRLA